MADTIGNLLSTGINVIANKKAQERQFEYNKELAGIQNQYNIDMWKMQADYNSPQQQMKRFEEAGLNPNLIYGQGNNGNMSTPPVQVAPEAPDMSKVAEAFKGLQDAFNIEGLRTTIANRKKAQAEAKDAEINAERNKQAFEGEKQFGLDYMYDGKTGRYIPVPESDELEVVAFPYARYLRNKILSENAYKTYLLPSQQLNLRSQRRLWNSARLLNEDRRLFLQPQIKMRNLDAKYYPYTMWVSPASKAAGAAFDLFKMFY